MPVIRTLVTKWKFDVDKRSLENADKKIKSIKKNVTSLGEKALTAGKFLTFGITLPVLGIGVAFLKAASDAEETNAKFNTVFKDLSKESKATAKDLAKNFGLSSTEAKELLADTGDLLTGFGFSQKSALDLSTQVNKLAVDLASFTNSSGGAVGASRALTKALLGERESIKTLGISILEEDVKRKVQANTLKGLSFETNRQAKAFATLQIAQDQSKNAIGDFARTSTGAANRMRILRARLRDISEGFGNILLPRVNKALGSLLKLLNVIKELPRSTKKLILIIVGFAAAIGPVILSLFLFNKVIQTVGTSIAILGPLFLKLRNQILLFRAGILIADGTFAAFALRMSKSVGVTSLFLAKWILLAIVVEDFIAFLQGKESFFGDFFGGTAIGDFALFIADGLKQFTKFDFGEVFEGMVISFEESLDEMRMMFSTFISDLTSAPFETIGEFFTGAFEPQTETLGENIQKNFSEEIAFFKKLLPALAPEVGPQFGPVPFKTGQNILRNQAPAGLNQVGRGSAGQNASPQVNITNNNNISVPPNTPPDLVTGALERAATKAFDNSMRNAFRSVESPMRN